MGICIEENVPGWVKISLNVCLPDIFISNGQISRGEEVDKNTRRTVANEENKKRQRNITPVYFVLLFTRIHHFSNEFCIKSLSSTGIEVNNRSSIAKKNMFASL